MYGILFLKYYTVENHGHFLYFSQENPIFFSKRANNSPILRKKWKNLGKIHFPMIFPSVLVIAAYSLNISVDVLHLGPLKRKNRQILFEMRLDFHVCSNRVSILQNSCSFETE